MLLHHCGIMFLFLEQVNLAHTGIINAHVELIISKHKILQHSNQKQAEKAERTSERERD